MDSDSYTGPTLGADSLDADVLAAGELFDGERILLRHNYNLLCGLYDVRNEETGKRKLLLLFPRMVGTDPDFANRFNATCSRLRGLRTDGLLTVEAFGKRGGRYYIQYEYFAGDCLSRWMHEGVPYRTNNNTSDDSRSTASQCTQSEIDNTPHPIPEATVKTMMDTIGGALQRLHRQGLHHYNLTLTSILFDGHNEFRLWGAGMYEMIGKPLFERLVSAGIPPIISKERRRLLDPVAGMSPEMRAGSPPDPRADIHGLALIGYEFITNRLPGTPASLPSELQPGISPHWDATLLKALSKTPEDRQETVEAFLRELDGQKVKPLTAWQKRRNTWLGNLRIFLLKHALSLSAIVLLMIAAAFFFNWTQGDKDIVETDTVADAPIRSIRNPDRATHVLEIQPSDAIVTTVGRDSQEFQTNVEGQIYLVVPSQQGRIRIQSQGYHAEDWILRDDGSQKPNRITIKLQRQFAKAKIHAHPDSIVYWRFADQANGDWQELGTIEEEEAALFEKLLPAGTIDLEVRHPFYRSVRFNAVDFPTDQLVALKAEQELRPAGLHVLTEPQGADVLLNGQKMGQAPLRIEGMVFAGPVELVIQLTNHHPYSMTLEPVPGSWSRIEIPPLKPITRALPVELSASDSGDNLLFDEQTVIKINGRRMESSDDGTLLLPLGMVELEISHPDYLSASRTLHLSETEPSSFSLTLQARPARLAIEIHPADSEVALLINGRRRTFSKTLELAAGKEYAIEIIIADHEAVTQTFQPKANAELTWRVAPDRLQALNADSPWTFPYSDYRFVWLPGGSFTMGSPRAERHRLPNENDGLGRQPEGIIQEGFWIAEIPVTQAFYQMITGENPSHFQNPQHPVETISWEAANAFAAKLTEQESAAGRLPEGYVFRLPTQLEWEFANRTGNNEPFSWGASATPEQGNFRGVYPRDPDRSAQFPTHNRTTPVRSFPPNEWGLYDMHGNVWEFTLDAYNDRFPNEPRLIDWMESRGRDSTVIRGGSWQDSADRSRSAARERMGRNQSNSATGFRLVIARPISAS
jgi:formylglycine-generating enzyme required for sulfatase activity/serine/threonine protein kinase